MKKKIVLGIAVLVVFVFILMLAYNISNSRSFQFFGEIIHKVDTQEKVVALTFDDGPTEKTNEILSILEDLDVKATFFVNGIDLEKNMEEARNIVVAGHELGNHTYSHSRMVLKSPTFVRTELSQTDELIREAGYEGEIHFRPPNGKKLLILPYILNQNNTKTIMWDIEPDSYPEIGSDSQKIVEHVVENIRPGSIILLHVMYDSRAESVKSLEGIVNELRDQGYNFKTVSELLMYKGGEGK